jgi:hypothetical protein
MYLYFQTNLIHWPSRRGTHERSQHVLIPCSSVAEERRGGHGKRWKQDTRVETERERERSPSIDWKQGDGARRSSSSSSGLAGSHPPHRHKKPRQNTSPTRLSQIESIQVQSPWLAGCEARPTCETNLQTWRATVVRVWLQRLGGLVNGRQRRTRRRRLIGLGLGDQAARTTGAKATLVMGHLLTQPWALGLCGSRALMQQL